MIKMSMARAILGVHNCSLMEVTQWWGVSSVELEPEYSAAMDTVAASRQDTPKLPPTLDSLVRPGVALMGGVRGAEEPTRPSC